MIAKLTAVAHLAILISLAILFAVLTFQVRETGRKVNTALDQVTQTTVEARRRIADTSQNLNAILVQTGLAADEMRRAATDQKSYWDQAGKQTVSALQKTNNVLDEAQRTLYSLNNSQQQIANATVRSLAGAPAAIEASTDAMKQAATDLQTVNQILGDAHIPATLAHVDATMAHLDSSTAAIDVAVKRWTKPGSMLKSLFMGVLDPASKLAVIVK